MINIFAEDTNLPGPVAAFSWCVEKRDIERLKELGAQKLFMLIIVAHQDSRGYFYQVNRRLVPFSQAVEYIEFHQPGVHRIFGWVVWSVDGLRALRREMKSRKFSVDLMGNANTEQWGFPRTLYYETSVGERNDNSGRAGMERDIPVGSADVVVPEGHFAKEPPSWLRWWVNFPYGAEPADQCHFRKRLLQAIFIQPFWVAAFILVKSLLNFALVLVLWLCGVRKINYETFLHPFFYALGDAYVVEKNSSWFIADSLGKNRPFFVFLAMPMVQIAVLAVISLTVFTLSESFGWWIAWWLLGINIGALTVAGIINLFGANLEMILDKLFGEDPELVKSRFEKEYARYGDVVCMGAPVRPGYENVPAGRRTLRLRFQYIKSKVCLPFARRRL